MRLITSFLLLLLLFCHVKLPASSFLKPPSLLPVRSEDSIMQREKPAGLYTRLAEVSVERDPGQAFDPLNRTEAPANTTYLNLLLIGIVILTLLLLIILRLNRKIKQNEKRLYYALKNLDSIIHSVDNLILVLDKNARIRLINKAAQNFYRTYLDLELENGNLLYEKLENEDREKWTHFIQKTRENEKWTTIFELSRGGNTFYFFKSFIQTPKANGTYNGLIMVGSDITEEKLLTLKLEEQATRLSEADSAKQKMLSLLAHDLKDTVFSAHGLSQLVIQHPEDYTREKLLNYFYILFQNFDKTRNLLEGLLEWIKTQTSGIRAIPDDFSLRDLVAEVILNVQEKANQKKVFIENKTPERCQVFSDREMIKTVLRNLISNAIKFTEPEAGRIRIFTVAKNGLCEIHVRDNGVGLQPGQAENLFNEAYNRSTLGTEKEQGTGLGLSLCRELLHLNGSRLEVGSSPGTGSDFYFKIAYSKTNGIA